MAAVSLSHPPSTDSSMDKAPSMLCGTMDVPVLRAVPANKLSPGSKSAGRARDEPCPPSFLFTAPTRIVLLPAQGAKPRPGAVGWPL